MRGVDRERRGIKPGRPVSMNKTFIDTCICRGKCRASANKNNMKRLPKRETAKQKEKKPRRENRASSESLTSPISKGLPAQPPGDARAFAQPREE